MGLAGLVLLVGGIVLGAFLWGPQLFVFCGWGSDTYYQYWPFGQFYGSWVRRGGWPGWSSAIGLGSQMSIPWQLLNPYAAWLYLLPTKAYAYGLVYKALLEYLGAALAWGLYARRLGLRGVAGLLLPLCFAFNGYLTLWGHHAEFGFLFTIVPLALYGLERLLVERQVWPLALALAWFLAENYYFCWMFGLFLAPFALLRHLTLYPWRGQEALACAGRLLGGGLLAALLAAWIWVPALLRLLDSPRIAPALSVSPTALFPPLTYAAMALRLLGDNVLGVDFHYLGPANYYEAPQLYAGLLPLLLLPQVFHLVGRRERLALAGAIGAMALALLSPWLSMAFNGFCALSHRHSFLAIVLVLYIAGRTCRQLAVGGRLSRPLLVGTYAALVVGPGIGWLAALPGAPAWPDTLPTLLRGLAPALVLLSLYTLLLARFDLVRHRFLPPLLLALTVAELGLATWPTHNRSATRAKSGLQRPEGYFDASYTAVQWLRAADPSFYRVHKTFTSVFLNDNLLQGYYGTQSYHSVQEPAVLAFYRGLDIPRWRFSEGYLPGFGDRVLLNTLVGVRYVLAREPLAWPGYSLFHETGDVRIYRNAGALPMGFACRRQISEAQWRQLPDLPRQMALLEACVLPDAAAAASALPPWPAAQRVREWGGNLAALAPDRRLTAVGGVLTRPTPETLAFCPTGVPAQVRLALDGAPAGAFSFACDILSPEQTWLQVGVDGPAGRNETAASRPLEVFIGRGRYGLDWFSPRPGAELVLEFPGTPTPPRRFELSGLCVARFPTQAYAQALAALQPRAFRLTRFAEDRLAGEVTAAGAELLFLPIPYNRGWQAWRNGTPVPVQRVNLGFLGVRLAPGPNRVELRFAASGGRLGAGLTLATLLAGAVWGGARWRGRRRSSPVTAAPSSG